MSLKFTRKSQKQFTKLPKYLKKKARKQFHFLLDDYHHASLRTRKMGGTDIFEARLDRQNRFTFTIAKDNVIVLSMGPHDQGLGKK